MWACRAICRAASIPFRPGMRALYDSRWDQAEDPHTRCKPSGGSRFWHTPYGIEIVDAAHSHAAADAAVAPSRCSFIEVPAFIERRYGFAI